ncbi:MAG: hypothetical protein ABIJ91_00910 [Candidatus Kuenenbacteria bacterium]
MKQKFGVTNFIYGTGPYLRTTELAIAFNDELAKQGKNRLSFIIPWVYGQKQKQIMIEDFGEHIKKYPKELLLCKDLGEILNKIFYPGGNYQAMLEKWVKLSQPVSRQAHHLLSSDIKVETFSGEKLKINARDIIIELNRAPRVHYGVAFAYSTLFAHTSDILENVLSTRQNTINIDHRLIKQAIPIAKTIESKQELFCMAYPATFSASTDHKGKYKNEFLVPPITGSPQVNKQNIAKGIYITVSGIPGLEKLYKKAASFNLKIYANNPQAIPGSLKLLPHVISNKNIIFQFARSGWGSVWLSLLSDTPLVIPDFDSNDDPEIYFNNLTIEKMNMGIVYRGQPIEDIIKKLPSIKKSYSNIKEKILKKWRTLDGNAVSAEIIAKNFLKKYL